MDEVLGSVSEEGLGVMLAHLAAQLSGPKWLMRH